MKTLGGATLAGVLVALLLIYWLGPLNNGAVALVILLCVSFMNLAAGAIVAFRKWAEAPGKPPRKNRGRRPKVLVLALLLAGCASAISKHPPPQAAAGEVARIPARSVLLHDQSPPAGYGAYGYVLFTTRPDSSNLPRYMAICQEYQNSLEAVTEFSDIPPAHLMVTFWLLRTPPAAQSCDALVASYDFSRATVLARSLGKLSSRGPILVAWRTPFQFGATQADEALVVDMSDFTNEGDVAETFRIWRDQISQDPGTWNDGFSLSLVRVALRSFLNTYGQQVVAILGGGGSR